VASIHDHISVYRDIVAALDARRHEIGHQLMGYFVVFS
jgi:hypothetical protein